MTTRRAKWLGGVLIVSLTLNLFLGGYLLGREVFHWWHDDRHHAHRADSPYRLQLRALGKSLPDAALETLRDELSAERHAIHERYRAIRAQRLEIARIMAAEPFDPARLEEAYARYNATLGDMHAGMGDILIAAARGMSKAERRAFADRLERMHRHRMDRRERRDTGD